MAAQTNVRRSVSARKFNTSGCHECKHYDDTGIFELCLHRQSAYRYELREDFHTIQHMRDETGLCGTEGRLLAK